MTRDVAAELRALADDDARTLYEGDVALLREAASLVEAADFGAHPIRDPWCDDLDEPAPSEARVCPECGKGRERGPIYSTDPCEGEGTYYVEECDNDWHDSALETATVPASTGVREEARVERLESALREIANHGEDNDPELPCDGACAEHMVEIACDALREPAPPTLKGEDE